MVRVPDCLIVTGGAFALDGGSISLALMSSDGVSHSLELWQGGIKQNASAERPPGALVLNGQLLATRGPDETAVLAALREARIEPTATRRKAKPHRAAGRAILGSDIQQVVDSVDDGPAAMIRSLVERVIAFV